MGDFVDIKAETGLAEDISYFSAVDLVQTGSNIPSGKGKGCPKVAGELAQALKD